MKNSSTVKTITCQQLHEARLKGPIDLIDVRTREEFEEIHAIGAHNLPLDTLTPTSAIQARTTEEQQPLYFICAVGGAADAKAQDASRTAVTRIARFMFHSPNYWSEFRCIKPSLFPGTPQKNLLAGHDDRITGCLFRSMDHQRTFHAGDIFFRRHRVGDEALERRKIARHAFEDEVHFTRQHVALAHLRPAPRAFLEMLEIAVFLAGQADKNKAGDFEA